MALAMRGISGDAHFFEEAMNIDRIRKLLDSKLGVAGNSEKLEAMKYLIASISKGEDVSIFFPHVVKNVIVASVEVKKLVYMYLVHYADMNSQCREVALLSINSFQKDLADPNQLIRALALRVMTSIRVKDIVQIQLIGIRKCAGDVSPYVRKCAANALSKVFLVDNEQQSILAEIIGKLLNDSSTMVLGSAVQAFDEVCPDRLDLLHGCYRKLCHLLADIDEWGQIITINVLIRYCRKQFCCINRSNVSDKRRNNSNVSQFNGEDSDVFGHLNGNFEKMNMLHGANARSHFMNTAADIYSTNGAGRDDMDEDHRLLLRSSIPLLKSRNSAVVLAVATLHYYCGSRSPAASTLVGKSLVRIMRNQREIQYVVLSAISSMVRSERDMFLPFLHDFFVRATDPVYARRLKLDILTSLVTETNLDTILREFQAYVRHVDKAFVTLTIQALGRVADAMPSVTERCLNGLMRLIRSSTDSVVAEGIIVIRQLLQHQKNDNDTFRVTRSLAAMLATNRVASASARASIVWMLGEFVNSDPLGEVCATEMLRIMTKNFTNEQSEVKLQILNLAVKLGVLQPQQAYVQQILHYVLELCKFDTDYDIRDRARFIRVALSENHDIVNPVKLFTTRKLPPLVGPQNADKSRYMLGSLSNLVQHTVPGYKPLPKWRTDQPDHYLREEDTIKNVHVSRQEQGENRKEDSRDFYSEESDNDSSEAASDDTSSKDSGNKSECTMQDAHSSQSESYASSESEYSSEDESDYSEKSNKQKDKSIAKGSPQKSTETSAAKKNEEVIDLLDF